MVISLCANSKSDDLVALDTFRVIDEEDEGDGGDSFRSVWDYSRKLDIVTCHMVAQCQVYRAEITTTKNK